jgi:hypothetical protein
MNPDYRQSTLCRQCSRCPIPVRNRDPLRGGRPAIDVRRRAIWEPDRRHGRQLRMRTVTIEPGGVFGPIHDHKDRPGIVYMLQGTITDHRNGVATDLITGRSPRRRLPHQC